MPGHRAQTLFSAAVALCGALTPVPAFAVEGSVSLEGTVGRLFSLTLLGDIGLSDSVFLTGGYGLVRPADVPGTDTVPAVRPAPTHLFSLGVDVGPSRHWLVSLQVTGSPLAKDSVVLNPDGRVPITLATWRRSLSGFVGLLYDSAGDSRLEGSADVGLSVAGYSLGRSVNARAFSREVVEPLYTYRPTAGLTLTAFTNHDFGLRGAYTFYSADPLTTGRFHSDELAAIQAARAAAGVELVQSVATYATTRLGQADALSGFTSAPVWFELRPSYLWRFRPTMSLQLSFTFMRYVPTQGHALLWSARYAWRLPKGFRVWLAATLQRDEPLDQPQQRTADDPSPSWSGLLTLGAEFAR